MKENNILYKVECINKTDSIFEDYLKINDNYLAWTINSDNLFMIFSEQGVLLGVHPKSYFKIIEIMSGNENYSQSNSNNNNSIIKVDVYSKVITDNYTINQERFNSIGSAIDNIIRRANDIKHKDKQDLKCLKEYIIRFIKNNLQDILNSYKNKPNTLLSYGFIKDTHNPLVQYKFDYTFDLNNNINLNKLDTLDGYNIIDSNYNSRDNILEIKIDKILKLYNLTNIHENKIYLDCEKICIDNINKNIIYLNDLSKVLDGIIQNYDITIDYSNMFSNFNY